MFSKQILKLIILTILLTFGINSSISLSTHACDASCSLKGTSIGDPYPLAQSSNLGGFGAPTKWQPTVINEPDNVVNIGGVPTTTTPAPTTQTAQSSEATKGCVVICYSHNENRTDTTVNQATTNNTTNNAQVSSSSSSSSSESSAVSTSSASVSSAPSTSINDDNKPLVIGIVLVTLAVCGVLFFIKKQLQK